LPRLRSPCWAVVLPGALLVGTFGVLAVPHGATGLAVLAALAVLSAGAVTLHSWPSQLASTALTALGCLTVGAALVRLTPLPWLAGGIAAMCIVDVALLATGVGQPAAHELKTALSHSALPEYHRLSSDRSARTIPIWFWQPRSAPRSPATRGS
jgi:hypothetical protein